MDAAQNRIVCPSCGNKYAWKEQLAGKRVKCSCGEAFSAPLEPPAAEAPADDLYGLSDEPAQAQPRRAIPVAESIPAEPVVTPAPISPAPTTGKVLAYQSKRADVRHGIPENWRLADLGLLLAMIALGLACRSIAPSMETAVGGARLGLTLLLVTFGLAFNVILMIAAMKVASMLADVDFGHPATATIKLGFIFVIASAAGAFCASLGKFDGIAITFGVHVTIILYWILFPLLFKTGLTETMWAVSIIIILQAIVNYGVWRI
jgi:hypothetical protein